MYRAPYEAITIQGRSQVQTPVTSAAAGSGALPEGVYDVWSSVDIWVAVGDTNGSVTPATGYLIRVGNIVPINVPAGQQLWGCTASASAIMSAFMVG